MYNESKYSNDAREKLFAGVEEIAKAVKCTLGAKGRNVLIETEGGIPHITKDGVTVATKYAKLKDPYENAGANLLKDVASRTAIIAGDGTSSSVVLAEAITKESKKYIDNGANPVDIKKGLDKALKDILKYLDDVAKPCLNHEDIKQIATVSANGDEELGQLIADAMDIAGIDGVIDVEASNSLDNELSQSDGMEVESGWVHHFFQNQKNGTCEFEKPLIFIYDASITRLAEIKSILEVAVQMGRPIVFICDDMASEALGVFINNIADPQTPLKGCTIKAPSIGKRRADLLDDIATYCGTEVNSLVAGLKLDDVGDNYEALQFGTCDKIIIDGKSTKIINGDYNEEAISNRVELITSLIEDKTSKEIEFNTERRANLLGKVAVIKLGASSAVELQEKMDRVDDAIRSTRCGAEEGLVAGGGITLLNASKKAKIEKSKYKSEQIAVDILRKAMRSPFEQIIKNAGLSHEVIESKLKKDIKHGYNVRTDKYVDMIEEGIIDPVKVTKTAITNAISVAGLIITTECAIVNIKEESDIAMPMMMPQYQ